MSCHLTDGDVDVALMSYDDAPEAHQLKSPCPTPGIHHIGMEVDDLDAYIAKIKASGGEILTAPGRVPVKFRSPNGPLVEMVPLGHWTKKNQAAEEQ